RGSDIRDVSFIEPSGEEMTDEAWSAGFVRCLGVRWAGNLIGELDERGEVITGDTLFILMNAHHETIPFTLPPHEEDAYWDLLFQRADVTQQERHPQGGARAGPVTAGAEARVRVPAESAVRALLPPQGPEAPAAVVTTEPVLRGGQQYYLQGRSLAILR